LRFESSPGSIIEVQEDENQRGVGRPSPRIWGDSDEQSEERQRGKAPMASERSERGGSRLEEPESSPGSIIEVQEDENQRGVGRPSPRIWGDS
jgi:hypothetical protein